MEAQLSVEEGPTAGGFHSLQPGDYCVLGQGPDAQLVLRDPALGPRHAAVKLDERGLWVMDLGCPAGTFLNQERLTPQAPVEVFPGDALALGSHLIRITLLGLPG